MPNELGAHYVRCGQLNITLGTLFLVLFFHFGLHIGMEIQIMGTLFLVLFFHFGMEIQPKITHPKGKATGFTKGLTLFSMGFQKV